MYGNKREHNFGLRLKIVELGCGGLFELSRDLVKIQFRNVAELSHMVVFSECEIPGSTKLMDLFLVIQGLDAISITNAQYFDICNFVEGIL